MSPRISGLTIVRNAISNGYLITEVIDTLVAVADEVIVCDGYSEDGTFEYLQTRNDIQLFQDNWDLQSNNGLEFAKITNQGLARCTGEYIFYLQADELIHESQIPQLKNLIETREYNSIIFQFNHIRYHFDYSLKGGYRHAARVVKKDGVYSRHDGFDFAGSINPKCFSGIDIYHYGYVFLENILAKMINHADNFYVSAPNYAKRKELSLEFLKRIRAGEQFDPLKLQKILEPEHSLQLHGLPIPACMERLRHATMYSLPLVQMP